MAVFSQANARMRRFLYRQPRFKTNLTMDFILDDAVLLGVCRSISESGVGGELSHPVQVGAAGLLTLYHGDQSVQVQAVVEALEDDGTRMSFRFASPQERDLLRKFIHALPGAPPQVNP